MLIAYLLYTLALLYGAVIYNVEAVCPKDCNCFESYVNCSNKLLNGFPEMLPPVVEYLDLGSNKIGEYLEIDTDSYERLTSLYLYKNSLISFPIFKNKTNINDLNLAHNKIDKLDSNSFDKVPYLEILDMSKNKLLFLDDNTFPQSTQLKVLNLNNNLISNLSGNSLSALIHLTELRLSHNKLYKLPNGIFKKLLKLEILDLSRNQLTAIEGLLFKNLAHMKILILRQNFIGDLPDGAFFGLTKLQSLRLENNNISKISKGWLYGLNSLNHLNISDNKIDQIISGWEYCGNLRELDISFNQLQYIDKYNVENLRKLQVLYLNNNKLSYIEEGSFHNTPSLEILIIDNNYLSWMIEDAKESFDGLTNLKKLSLVNNKILYIKNDAFYGLENLNELNMLQNNIVEIQEDGFKFMPNLVYLYLNSSSLVCDCSLSWLKQQNIFENLFNVINLICGFPKQNEGKSIENLSITDFTCLEYSPKPKLIFHPESKVALERQNITLKCGVNSSSPEKINFVWKKDKRNLEFISSNHYSSVDFNGVTQYSILNLYNISMSQSGEYQCVASNKFGVIYSNHSILSVVIFPSFTKAPKNSSVKIGFTAKLECSANGYPIPQISWQKDGGNNFPAAQERRMRVDSKDDTFLIVNLKLVDMGIYSCTAKNAGGTISANTTLTVLEPPRFESKIGNKQANVGEKIVLECLNSGFPKPKVQWKKGGILLATDDRHYITGDGQLLIIMETNVNDKGVYQCVITNSVGVQVQEFEILIMPFYRNIYHSYALWSVILVAVVCIIITSAIWLFFIYRVRRQSPNLITDDKLTNTTNAKDNDANESLRGIPMQLNNKCLKTSQKLNNETEDIAPETTSPLLPHSTVILGENSVKYMHSTNNTVSANPSTEKPCSITVHSKNGSQ